MLTRPQAWEVGGAMDRSIQSDSDQLFTFASIRKGKSQNQQWINQRKRRFLGGRQTEEVWRQSELVDCNSLHAGLPLSNTHTTQRVQNKAVRLFPPPPSLSPLGWPKRVLQLDNPTKSAVVMRSGLYPLSTCKNTQTRHQGAGTRSKFQAMFLFGS